MTISKDFEGGNIRVVSIEEEHVRLECELRDTEGDWFYWAFRVQGAAGKKVRFDFAPKDRVGSFGAAVSRDFVHWTWGGVPDEEFTSFTYEFGPEEDDVYFCHSLPYSTERFARFADELSLPVTELCRSEQGRSVPMATMGEGETVWLLTSRHHCCESTGTYVMEGILAELSEGLPEGVRVIAVPFMDMDGVVNGDQGKNRAPHDHNRDYIDEPVYETVRSIQALAGREKIAFMIDLHAPYHRDDRYPFEVRKNRAMRPAQERFSELLAAECAKDAKAFRYVSGHDMDVGVSWNKEDVMSAASTGFFAHREGMKLCMTMETPYFGTEDNTATQDGLIRYGRCMARALRAAHSELR